MVSIKGPGFRIFAAVIGLAALVFGIYSAFIQSAGYEKTTATIISIEKDENSADDDSYIVTAKYTVDGKEYIQTLDSYSASCKEGDTVEVRYDPDDPSKVTSGFGFGIYAMAVGAVMLLLAVFTAVRQKKSVKELKETYGETAYAPSEKGEERRLYFLTDLGTPKFGHRIEDQDRKVLYEAKMTKFTMLSDYEFDFIDHENKKTVRHLIGHTETMDWDSILIDNNYTFALDGEDVWKHLRNQGITIDSRFGKAGGIMPSYDIRRNGEEFAYVEGSSQYVHEEDAERHSIASRIPYPLFFRVLTREKNLDLLFMVLVAMARSGATDEQGGSRRMLINTVTGE